MSKAAEGADAIAVHTSVRAVSVIPVIKAVCQNKLFVYGPTLNMSAYVFMCGLVIHQVVINWLRSRRGVRERVISTPSRRNPSQRWLLDNAVNILV